jgi:hypothetical protein
MSVEQAPNSEESFEAGESAEAQLPDIASGTPQAQEPQVHSKTGERLERVRRALDSF